ncbi:hypothetical protein GGH97_001267, partial [Coemansia sp. RSA 475]
MVRQYFRAKSQDASPFLGISECPQGSDTETRDTMRRETRQYYSQVPVPPVPEVSKLRINVRVAQGTGPTRDETRPTTQRSQASSMYSVSSIISPLVVGLTPSGQLPRRAFAVTVDANEATLVEELARVIESTTHHEFACVALFRGRTPLLFGQRVRDVLRANDTVVVYTGDDCCDAGTSQGSSSGSSDLVIIDFARAATQDDECLFVPLSETRMPLLETRMPRLRVSSALSAVSVGRVDMGPVGR